ncbi:protein of unknown function [Methanoculleus bourgensis]|uniref:indole-3-glycerol-phosphate synthase n=1 Tax=Methanoculleus bourgensis TaxID=83986 RepID=A0A0X3BMF9_9EURY|nr:protein of unknown function [Methanoculleus bourgensis]
MKYASPSGGRAACTSPPEALAVEFAAAGAVGVSVLTEPSFFAGSAANLIRVPRRGPPPGAQERLHRRRAAGRRDPGDGGRRDPPDRPGAR